MPYPFFFSYASDDERASKRNETDERGRVRELYEYIRRAVNGARGINEAGFFASRSINEGDEWPEELAEALNSSHVLVCLRSPFYFRSEGCGKELEVFLQRRRLWRRQDPNPRQPAPPRCIINVTWLPHEPPPLSVPDDIQASKRFEHGVLKAMLDDQNNGTARVESYGLELGARIADLIKKNTAGRALPTLRRAPAWHATRSAFELPEWPLPSVDDEGATGPLSVTFVYPAEADPNSLPWAPPPNAVVRAAALAKREEWIFQGVGLQTPGEAWEKDIQFAQGNNSRIVVMLTEAHLKDQELLTRLGKIPPKGTATAVLSTSIKALPNEFPAHHRPNAFIATREKLDEMLFMKLERLRDALETVPTSEGTGPSTWG